MAVARKIAPVFSIIVIVIASIVALPHQQDASTFRRTGRIENMPNLIYLDPPGSSPARDNGTDFRLTNENGMVIIQNRIAGGNIADILDFPWTVMLLYDINYSRIAQYGCGGALISRSFVVTAAHCIIDGTSTTRPLKFVRLREYDIHNDPDCLIGEVSRICSEPKIDSKPRNVTIHPGYNVSDSNNYHDIALIEIDPTPPYSDFLRPVCLPGPEMDNGVTIGEEFVVSGWGRTDVFHSQLGSNALSPVKLKVFLPYVEPEICKRMLPWKDFVLGSGQICAGGEIGRDACGGDSGSPLMHYDARKKVWVLTGIVSMGIQDCGTEGIPGLYTNVRQYLVWIKYHTELSRERQDGIEC